MHSVFETLLDSLLSVIRVKIFYEMLRKISIGRSVIRVVDLPSRRDCMPLGNSMKLW